jgi:hypothetical protein
MSAESKHTPPFSVTGYSENLWCIVDSTRLRVDWTDQRGWRMVFDDKAEAEKLAAELSAEAGRSPGKPLKKA